MTDDLDRRLRARMARLAESVPTFERGQRAVTGVVVRPSPRMSSSGDGLAVAGIAVLIIVAAAVIGGSRLPAAGEEPAPSAIATAPEPSASIPAPTATQSEPITMPPAGVAVPYPDGCVAYRISPRRCDYIVAWAREEAGYEVPDVVAVQLLGDPLCPDGSTTCGVRLGFEHIVRVRLLMADGSSSDQSVLCGIGRVHSPLCTDTPVIRRSSPTMAGGYLDVPCGGPAPEHPCASPVPSPDASALAAAVPLRVHRLAIPIDHIGTYSIPVGNAELPNGILTEASFDLVNDTPTDVLVSPDGVFLAVESLDGGRPFENIHGHGWRPGTERVAARLTFTVESFDPGAVLEVADVEVR